MSSGVFEKGKDYKSDVPPTWCLGCGDYGLLNTFYKALAEMKCDIFNTSIISGIGCSSRFPFFVKGYNFHGVHGRALTIAAGVKLANPDLHVVAFGGDGDGFAIGGGHVPHVCRRNLDITYIVMDNNIYGLTKGQMSPTSKVGMKTNTTPYGVPERPVNPLAFVLTYGATYVAQTFSGNPKHMKKVISEAMAHKGFSFVNVISPCPTFNKEDTFDFFKKNLVVMEDNDTSDKGQALIKALSPEGRLTLGTYYVEEGTETYDDRIHHNIAAANGSDTPDMDKIFDIYRP